MCFGTRNVITVFAMAWDGTTLHGSGFTLTSKLHGSKKNWPGLIRGRCCLRNNSTWFLHSLARNYHHGKQATFAEHRRRHCRQAGRPATVVIFNIQESATGGPFALSQRLALLRRWLSVDGF
jgi:hypothetical protein